MNRADADSCLSSRERRARVDRRSRLWWSVFYGNFNPRRRATPRRLGDLRFHSVDWHSSHLLAVAIGILLLSVLDAFLTLELMQKGAYEANPFMALFVHRDAAVFTALKMGLTGAGIVFMVFLARYRFMRLLPVRWLLYAILLGYASLIGYEVSMLEVPLDLPIL